MIGKSTVDCPVCGDDYSRVLKVSSEIKIVTLNHFVQLVTTDWTVYGTSSRLLYELRTYPVPISNTFLEYFSVFVNIDVAF